MTNKRYLNLESYTGNSISKRKREVHRELYYPSNNTSKSLLCRSLTDYAQRVTDCT